MTCAYLHAGQPLPHTRTCGGVQLQDTTSIGQVPAACRCLRRQVREDSMDLASPRHSHTPGPQVSHVHTHHAHGPGITCTHPRYHMYTPQVSHVHTPGITCTHHMYTPQVSHVHTPNCAPQEKPTPDLILQPLLCWG